MSFVIGAACVGCKDTKCVEVCPVDCFYEGPDMLYIDPEECIDCGACIPECPVEAIFLDEDVPADQLAYIEINARLAKDYPVITGTKDAHPEAEQYRDVSGKQALI